MKWKPKSILFFFQVLLGQPHSNELFGFCATYLEQRLEERESRMMQSQQQTPREERPRPSIEPQNSFERNIAEITRQSVHSATLNPLDSPATKKKALRREGTFSIYDSGKTNHGCDLAQEVALKVKKHWRKKPNTLYSLWNVLGLFLKVTEQSTQQRATQAQFLNLTSWPYICKYVHFEFCL